MEEVLNEEKIEYVNRETGLVLTNSVDIEYYKTIQNDTIIENGLLGSFTKEGRYSIEKKFLIELVKIKKFVVESFEYKYVLNSILEDKELTFTLVIEDSISEEKKVATLRFIEKIIKEDGSEELLKTNVATYRDDPDIYFVKKAFKVFNIVEKSDVEGKSNEEELLSILNRFKEIKILKAKRISVLDYISSAYIDTILAVLRANPCKFSEFVLRKYGEGLASLRDKISADNYYILVRRMLDRILDGAKVQLKDERILSQILKAKQNFVNSYKKLHEELTAAPKKEELQKQKQNSSAEPAQKPSGGGAKKKASPKVKSAGKKPAKKAAPQKSVTYFDRSMSVYPKEVRREQKPKHREKEEDLAELQMRMRLENMLTRKFSFYIDEKMENAFEKKIYSFTDEKTGNALARGAVTSQRVENKFEAGMEMN